MLGCSGRQSVALVAQRCEEGGGDCAFGTGYGESGRDQSAQYQLLECRRKECYAGARIAGLHEGVCPLLREKGGARVKRGQLWRAWISKVSRRQRYTGHARTPKPTLTPR